MTKYTELRYKRVPKIKSLCTNKNIGRKSYLYNVIKLIYGLKKLRHS